MLRHRLFPLLVVTVAALAVSAARDSGLEWDWSMGAHRLHANTLALLATLEGPVEVEVFLEDLPVQRAALERLLARYRKAYPAFHYRFTDPTRVPDRVRRLGIARTPTLLLRHQGGEIRVEPPVDEETVSNALARLARRGSRWIGAVTGHGEARLHGDGGYDLSAFGRLLESQGHRILELDLTTTRVIPENMKLIVLAAPQHALSLVEAGRILRHVEQGGSLLWLAGASPSTFLADNLSLKFLPGTVVDAAAADLDQPTPTVAVGRPAADHQVTSRLEGPVLLPTAHALETRPGPWHAAALLSTGPRSWNETGPVTGTIRRDPAAGERAGPLTLAVALEKEDRRVAVVGDADFLSNAFIGQGANRAFGLALVRWLTGNDRLVEVPPRQAPDLELRWPAAWISAGAALFLMGLPTALALTGLAVLWWRRRR